MNDIRLYRYHFLLDWMSYGHESDLGHNTQENMSFFAIEFETQNVGLTQNNPWQSDKMAAELVLFEELVPVLGKFLYVLALDCQYHSDTRTAVPPVAANLSACSNICSQLPQSDSQYLRYQQYCDCLLSQLLGTAIYKYLTVSRQFCVF